MDKSKVASVGSFIALAGLISIVLSVVGYNLRLLMWIDMWGEGAGWGIRIALVVLGGALFAFGKSGASEAEEEKPAADGG